MKSVKKIFKSQEESIYNWQLKIASPNSEA